jgi:hypothetical protein
MIGETEIERLLPLAYDSDEEDTSRTDRPKRGSQNAARLPVVTAAIPPRSWPGEID